MRYTDWKTWCVGRCLIDLPVGATVEYTDTKLNGNPLKPMPELTPDRLAEVARRRVEELKAQSHTKERNMFRGSYDLPNGGVYIDQWLDYDMTYVGKAEVYLICGGRVYSYSAETSPGKTQVALDWYSQIAQALRPTAPGEIPTVPGFCGRDFIVLNTPSFREEYAEIRVSFPGYPEGLKFYFSPATSTPSREPLAGNVDPMEDGCVHLGGRQELVSCDTLREAPHRVGAIDAYELCVAGHVTKTRARMYAFNWQTPGKPYDYAAPIINADLLFTMGSNRHRRIEAGAFFSDEEALILWDGLINSIRLRPTTQSNALTTFLSAA